MAWYPCSNCCDKNCAHEQCNSPNVCCIKVVLAGITDGTCTAGNCLNGTYYLAWRQGAGSSYGDWYRDLTDANGQPQFCNVEGLQAEFDINDSDEYVLRVELRVKDQSEHAWEYNFGLSMPACVQTSLSLTHTDTGGGGFVTSASSCTVTTLPITIGSPQDCPPTTSGCAARCGCGQIANELFVQPSGLADQLPCIAFGSVKGCASLNGQTFVLQYGVERGHRWLGGCVWGFDTWHVLCPGRGDQSLYYWGMTVRLEAGVWGGEAHTRLWAEVLFDNGSGHADESQLFQSGLLNYPLDCTAITETLAYVPRTSRISCDLTGASLMVTTAPP